MMRAFIGLRADWCRHNLPWSCVAKTLGVAVNTSRVVYNRRGGENGPVTVAAFKAADSALRGSNGGFDSHTPPPYFIWLGNHKRNEAAKGGDSITTQTRRYPSELDLNGGRL